MQRQFWPWLAALQFRWRYRRFEEPTVRKTLTVATRSVATRSVATRSVATRSMLPAKDAPIIEGIKIVAVSRN